MNSPSWAVSAVVADAGPLIALGRLDRLALLPAIFQEIQVPRVVLAECLLRPALADARRIEDAVAHGWLLACDAVPIEAAGLGLGERAALGRAQEIGAALLADDKGARLRAVQLGIATVGTLGILVKAHQLGLLPDVPNTIDQLRSTGYWLSEAAVAQAIAAARHRR